MSRAVQLVVTCVAVLLAVAGQVQAMPIVMPSNLSPGDQYRLAFLTSQVRDATSSDIVDYNSFVDALGDTLFASDWRAVASTATVNARDNTSTDPTPVGVTGFPIFLLNDTVLAVSYDDLWDGRIDVFFNIGIDGSPVDTEFAWTGTGASGLGFVPLGSSLGRVGETLDDDSGWISHLNADTVTPRSFYAISSVLTVPSTVPEPSSLALLGMGAIGFIGYGWRRKRKLAA